MPTRDAENFKQAKLDFDAECPSCSASIEFNPASGKLTCPYCGYETEIAAPEKQEEKVAQEMEFAMAEERGNFNWGVEKKTVICKSCAAETIYDALQVADSCPYCGSNQVMEASAKNTLAPNGVCAFEITDKQAGENFQSWIKGKWFTPKAAKESAKPDSFKGVYLPYWTFDTKTSSRYSARYGRHRTVTDKEGNTRTETDWYSTSGFYQEFIDDHLISATARYDRNMMRKIEPFNLLNNKAYKPEYVSGFLSERYSIGLQDGWSQAKREISDHLEAQITSKIRWEHNADVVSSLHFSTTHDDITYKYLMLPIWLSSFRYKEKVYRFMVNGQTGRVGGDAPISPLRVTIAVILSLITIAIIWYFFMSE
ncbi:hypothetical protein ABE61_19555 [Lysinibacillus sphaericus]|uniref:hypothetical protein n=1 Tax=Lysinibacillus sphaericus TaxID=1421 RepID=UPI0018CFE2C9|nr:hypothetical protein [Lysinibacillus sphaericus]MBG9479241.1 hypothetical protein [Lysinibacillus sphaericus]MBG9591529.1 hypothetical protein [Lysinibacillus sphaericus]